MSDQQQEAQSLQVVETVKGTALSNYGERDDVNELMDRLMALHPEAQKFGKKSMRTIAQLAILTGANPIPTTGEIWIWSDHKGQPIIDLGIAFYRRRAREVDTIIWNREPGMMSPADAERYGVPPSAIVAICAGSRLSEVKELVAAGCDFPQAVMLTRREGVGIVDEEELTTRKGYPNKPPRGKSWQWVANKRAEKDFYRKQGLLHANKMDSLVEAGGKIVAEEFSRHFEPQEQPFEELEAGDVETINGELFG